MLGVIIPSSRAANATPGLYIDPGGNSPPVVLSRKGLNGFCVKRLHSSKLIPVCMVLGLNPGALTAARISPLLGLRTTIAPCFSEK